MNSRIHISFLVVSSIISFTIISAVGKTGRLKPPDYPQVEEETTSSSDASYDQLAFAKVDTPPEDELPYPIDDRNTDFLNTPDDNSFDLEDPSIIQQNVEYDPVTGQYVITETIGDHFYRNPTYMSFEEYLEYEYKKSEDSYWSQRSNTSLLLSQKSVIPEVNVNNRLFDRIFGGTKVDIRPQGNIDLTFGGNYQNILNPTLTKRQRHQGGFDFDMNIQMNVIGKIGDKLKLTTNYNTGAVFNFENQVKLDYTGYQDEIIKKIEAGNVSLPLKGSLITGNQSLFGLKTQLQFGRLTVTGVISQQQSQAQNITVQGGSQTQTFRILADQYDENRNFLLAQYFRNNYNAALSTIPIISSQVTINKIEVWVTNKTGATVDVRDIVAFMDLGEANPYNTALSNGGQNVLPYANNLNPALNSNNLYGNLLSDPNTRSIDKTIQTLTSPPFSLLGVQDFEKTYARKLAPNEYTFDPYIGYVMLNQQLDPDDVLAVAYQYTVNGQVYQVGEFASDVPPNVDTPNVLFLKMLKSTSTRPKLPIWDLMMKNIYSLGAYQINSQDFFLDIYYLDPGGGEKRYVPADNINGTPLIQVLGLDRLNNQQDPQPDGVFDFIPGITINPANGKVVFPVLEPFGTDLAKKFSNPVVAAQYVYQVLYDSTKTIALQFPEFNRYFLKGTYKSSFSSEISLGAFNVPQGSVTVTAGGQQLVENVDYTVDYNLGRVKILNQSLLNSGVPINVSFENNELFSFITKTLFGTRLDYYINDKLSIGGTLLKLWERPYTVKLNAGDDPISNAIYGVDGSYTSESEFLTKIVDAIPLIDTKEKSSITISGEAARLDPGHSKAIGKEGTVYIDDFEGTQTTYDLRFPFVSWSLASTPQDLSLFPESSKINDLSYGFNRAKLSWYNIDPFFWSTTQAPDGIKGVAFEQDNFYSRQVLQNEIFPEKDLSNTPYDQNENTFDLRYEPRKIGPYNFDTSNLVLVDGVIGFDTTLTNNVSKRWAGIQRSIDQTDFEEANVEYLQFWVLDPFLYDTEGKASGDLYINLGNISEDVLRDSKFFYENGLSPTGDKSVQDSTTWSYTPRVPPVTDAFDNDPNARQFQDVGFDGNITSNEATFYQKYIQALATIYGAASPVYNAALNDPSNDNYRYYDDPAWTSNEGILDRYTKYNNPEGNSPVSTGNQAVSFAATNEPESEDLNRDNTVNENEEFFQYRMRLSPQVLNQIGTGFVVDSVETVVKGISGGDEIERWYQIKIPLSAYEKKIGSIQDFKSIRFVRMYLTGFDTTVILRFARMELVRNQWRKYLFSLREPGEYPVPDNSGATYFNVTSVSLEENSNRQPVHYVLPPGVTREQIVGQVATTFQNEQSLSLQIGNLQDGDSRAVYKNIYLDLRQYHHLQMFTHAEAVKQQPLEDGELTAFIRLGSDFVSNYYEYEVPLVVTDSGSEAPINVWPEANNFDIVLEELVAAKQSRNQSGLPTTVPFSIPSSTGGKITIVGNPDLGIVVTAMLGIRNPKGAGPDPGDDSPKSTEVWFDELRLTGFNEQGGYAAIARADIRLADLGTVALSGSMHTIGFGQLEQQLNERFRDNYTQYDAATSLELGKLFPKNVGIKLPLYAGLSKSISNPQYDPYDHDILLKDKLNLIDDAAAKSAAKKAAQTYTSIGSLNFTNIRKVSTGKSKLRIYSPENLNLTYAYTRTFIHNPIIESDVIRQHHAEFAYGFPGKSKFLSPFEKLIPSKNKWLKLIRDFNLNPFPTNLSFRTAMDRQFGETRLRPISQDEIIIPTYNKFWTWDRLAGFKFDISKGLNFDFNALANTRIDEPQGLIDTQEEKDSIWNNIKKFGRTTYYNHSANINYTVPLNKIPLLDWTQATARYGSNYGWITGPLVLDSATNRIIPSPLGNTISNAQNIALNGDMNFRNLYNKSKFLKRYDTNASGGAKSQAQKKPSKKDDQKQAQDSTQTSKSTSKKTKTIGAEAFFIRIPLMLKRITLNYTETHGTILPGYLLQPKFIGQDFNAKAPGWDFIFGYQPDTNWLNEKALSGWLSADSAMNYPFVQNSTKNFSMKGSFEPFKDFLIDLNFNKSESDNFSEYFKVPTATSGFEHLSKVQFGTFTTSYIAIKTSFVTIKPNQFSQTFREFEDYRETISSRLTQVNPNSGGLPFGNDTTGGTYYKGYGPYSQDVLIPSFIAAYTGLNPETVDLGVPINNFPLPNWRVTYNGVTKMAWAKNIWNSVNISHAYNSTLAIASFQSSLDFVGGDVFLPSKIDSLSGNFITYYDIPAISITEQFAPLIGIDMTWKNSLTTKLEYKRSRALALSFLDYQLTESRTEEITGGIGYKFQNVPVPFKINGKKRLKNDLNFLMNISFADNLTVSQKLDQEIPAQATAGIQTLSFSPSLDYVVSNRLSIRLFFDKRYTIPKISNSYPIRYTDGGVTIRFSLDQ